LRHEASQSQLHSVATNLGIRSDEIASRLEMGGFGSGRWYRYGKTTATDDVKQIDIRVLRKWGCLPNDCDFHGTRFCTLSWSRRRPTNRLSFVRNNPQQFAFGVSLSARVWRVGRHQSDYSFRSHPVPLWRWADLVSMSALRCPRRCSVCGRYPVSLSALLQVTVLVATRELYRPHEPQSQED